MAGDLQHCPTCDEEYVAGVRACVECGGPLSPGPLARFAAPATAAPTASAAPAASDALLDRLPGTKADHAVRALLLEDIPCRVQCQGLSKGYTPGSPPAEPFAVSLPVAIYVPSAKLDAAREVLDSFGHDDLIGDQWSVEDQGGAADDPAIEPLPVVTDEHEAEPEDTEPEGLDAPAAEGTGLRTLLLIVAVLVALLFLFGR